MYSYRPNRNTDILRFLPKVIDDGLVCGLRSCCADALWNVPMWTTQLTELRDSFRTGNFAEMVADSVTEL